MTTTDHILSTVGHLPPEQQRQVLEFALALQEQLEDDEKALGEAGVKLATQILEPEDFSDWTGPGDDQP